MDVYGRLQPGNETKGSGLPDGYLGRADAKRLELAQLLGRPSSAD
jgi:hypothetical protein